MVAVRRISLLLLAASLLAVSANAQIPPQRDSIATRVLTRLRLPDYSSTVTAAVVRQAINDAQTPVCQDFDAFDKLDTLFLSKASEGVTLPADFLRVWYVDRMIGDTLRVPMVEIDPRMRWATTGGSLSGAAYNLASIADPRFYWTSGARLFTHPKDMKASNRPDTVLLSYYAVGHQLTSATDSTDIGPDFREALILKATALLWRVREGAASPEAAATEVLYQNEVKQYGRKK